MGSAVRKQPKKHASSFGSIHQVGVAVSIGFPLMVIGVLTLMVFMISWLGTGTFLWVLAGLILGLGVIGAASRRVI
jgi:hypothetical protein